MFNTKNILLIANNLCYIIVTSTLFNFGWSRSLLTHIHIWLSRSVGHLGQWYWPWYVYTYISQLGYQLWHLRDLIICWGNMYKVRAASFKLLLSCYFPSKSNLITFKVSCWGYSWLTSYWCYITGSHMIEELLVILPTCSILYPC